MRKLKLMTIVGTRPEIIKLSETIKKCDRYFDHILVHTGQNYDYTLNEVFFNELGIRKPDHYLGVVGSNLGETMGNVIAKSYNLMMEVAPDALLVLGDTNSCLSVISAKRLKIPVFHMEAGNRCFDENLPEEINRRIVDVTSDVNLCYSEHARRYLNASSVPKDRTFVVGSPMAEVLGVHLEKIEQSIVLDTLKLEAGKYFLLSAHREENIDNERNFLSLMNAVNEIAESYGFPIIDYNCLQKHAYCVISDSGTLPEEAAYFKFPAVSLRTSTERPESMDKGVFIIGSIQDEEIFQAINLAVSMHQDGDRGSDVVDYSDTNVSTKIVKIIQSYTSITNSVVWKK